MVGSRLFQAPAYHLQFFNMLHILHILSIFFQRQGLLPLLLPNIFEDMEQLSSASWLKDHHFCSDACHISMAFIKPQKGVAAAARGS